MFSCSEYNSIGTEFSAGYSNYAKIPFALCVSHPGEAFDLESRYWLKVNTGLVIRVFYEKQWLPGADCC